MRDSPIYSLRGTFGDITQNDAISILVKGNASAAVRAIAKAFRSTHIIEDVYGKRLSLSGRPRYAFRFCTSPWTNVLCDRYRDSATEVARIASEISVDLASVVLYFWFDDMAGVLQYRVYEVGVVRELIMFDASSETPKVISKVRLRRLLADRCKSGFWFYSDARRCPVDLRADSILGFFAQPSHRKMKKVLA